MSQLLPEAIMTTEP